MINDPDNMMVMLLSWHQYGSANISATCDKETVKKYMGIVHVLVENDLMIWSGNSAFLTIFGMNCIKTGLEISDGY